MTRQPDFVIVGAAKSATTWLQRNLQQHSAVFMPGAETHYFSRNFAKGPAWYAAFFEAAAPHQIVGERSNSYLEHPEAPKRLREALPEVRLIVQLRNPIERVFAHYRAQRQENESGGAGLVDVDAERLRDGGLYFRHLSRFLALFPREQLCITLYDDLDREPAGVLDRIRAHIGLAGGVAAPVAPIGVADGQAAGATGRRPPRRPELGEALLARLRRYYEDDVRALSELLGRDLSCWLSPARTQG